MAKYQQYEEYKDSGVEWLSQLPVGWDIERTKRMLCLRRQLVGASSLNYQLLSLTLRGVIPRDISNGDGKIPADFSTYQEVETKDLVFCLFDIDETPRTVGLSPENGMITGAYNVYRTSDICSSRYAYYYFLHIDLRKGLRPFYTGLRKVVRSETFGNIKMPCPPYKEQAKIADFLDHETTQIDTLIEKQQTLIQLLKEKRQAVISHAVTKGLNPDVPMKDSGVEWLGEVPAHWSFQPLRYVGSCQNGINIGAEFFGSGYPFVSYGDAYRNIELPKKVEGLVQSTEKDRISYSVRRGDVIFTRTSETIEEIGLASTCLMDIKDATFAGFLIRFRPLDNFLYPEFSKYYFRSSKLRFFFVNEMNIVTRASLSQELLKKLPVLLPPIEEQRQIANKLHKQEVIFEKLIENAFNAIELMKERRTALISAAVTGKIDVRGWVAPDNA